MNKFKTPNSAAFLSSILPQNYPYVYMGEINEQHYNDDILKRYKGVQKTGNKSSLLHFKTYDWVSDDYKIELKTRNNNYNAYDTTMIGFNKIQDWKKDNTSRKYFFLFGYLDGLFEWELNNENYEKIGGDNAVKTKSFNQKTTTYSTFNENKNHIYIPIKELKKITEKGVLVPEELLWKSPQKISGCLI